MVKPLCVNGSYVSRTLPLAFDESLSYLEILGAILDKLNECIEQLNAYPDLLDKYEEYLIQIKQEVGKLEIEFANFKTDTLGSIDLRFSTLTTQQYEYINNQFALIEYNLDLALNGLQAQIDDIVAGDIKVYDPTTGLLSPIQTVIDNMFDMNRTNAITCTEFDGIELTATAFDAVEITAFNFDTNGKELLNL